MDITAEKIVINGKTYVSETSVPPAVPTGNRHVIVIDRGWVVAGDLVVKEDRLYLNRAVHVLSWSGCGFDGMLRDPKSSNVKLKKFDHVLNAPADSEIFRVQVSNDWGM